MLPILLLGSTYAGTITGDVIVQPLINAQCDAALARFKGLWDMARTEHLHMEMPAISAEYAIPANVFDHQKMLSYYTKR